MHDRDYDIAPTHRRKGGTRGEYSDPEIGALRQELTDASVQITRVEGELSESQAAIEKLKKERRKLRDEVARLRNEIAAKDTAVGEVLAAREDAESRAVALAGELNKIEGELMMAQEEAIRLRAESETLTSERAEILPRLEAAELEAETASLRLRECDIEIGELRTKLSGTQAERTAALREIQVLEARVTALDAELAVTNRSASETDARLLVAIEEIATEKKSLAEAEERAKSLAICVEELEKDRDGLRKSLSEDTTGKDLVEAREHLRVTGKERDRLTVRVQQLEVEIEAGRTQRSGIEEQLKSLQRELDETRRRVDAASEVRLRQDNEVLRGIIARQNAELEQRHVQIVRLKRAQLGVKLAYAAFGIGLVIVALWAMKTVPGLRLGNLF
ncbi:MAG: hypothetical protein ABMA13_03510 [Chthoniobacteraceae bacterium]